MSSPVNYDRYIIRYIINYLKKNRMDKALLLMYEYIHNEHIIKAIHDYLLGLNCRYPNIKFDNSIKECGIYNNFISELNFEVVDIETTVQNCPCKSLVCENWKYFARPSNQIWNIAPMEFFTNEYFQLGFLSK